MANSAAAGGGAPQWLFEGPEQQRQLDEAMRVFAERGHRGLARLVSRILQQPRLAEAMRVLNGDGDEERGGGGGLLADRVLEEFCRMLTGSVFRILHAGYDEHETFQFFRQLALLAARETAGSAVARLEKRTFRAGGDAGRGGGGAECCICFGEFVEGEDVGVMPCPSRGHEFHPDCITKWLGISNTCPICRHGLAC